jgi:hypothetical protein
MPRQYLSPGDLNATIIGQIFATQIAGLPSGSLDGMLFRASMRADRFCKRRLGAPGSTTVGTGGCIAGATLIPLTSTLAIDNLDEQVMLIGSGGSLETLTIVSGSAKPASPLVPPYPGTVKVATPCQFNHPNGDSVQVAYQETRHVGSSSGQDLYEDVVTQQAQIAAAHAGGFSTLEGDRARHHWLWQYPLVTILDMQHAYPYTNQYQEVDLPSLLLEPDRSHIKFPVGTFILSGGMLKTVYTAGYQAVPDDIVEAVSYFVGDELRLFSNAENAIQKQILRRNVKFSNAVGKTQYVYQAEEALADYVR